MLREKNIKEKELEKTLSVFYLHNANYEGFGQILVEYRKAYTKRCQIPTEFVKYDGCYATTPSQKRRRLL